MDSIVVSVVRALSLSLLVQRAVAALVVEGAVPELVAGRVFVELMIVAAVDV